MPSSHPAQSPRVFERLPQEAIHHTAFRRIPESGEPRECRPFFHPAQPLCLLVWTRGGGLGGCGPRHPRHETAPERLLDEPIWFRGPALRPWIGLSQPGSEQLLVWIYPDVVPGLFGIDLGGLCDGGISWRTPWISQPWADWAEAIRESEWHDLCAVGDSHDLTAGRKADSMGDGTSRLESWWAGYRERLDRQVSGKCSRTRQRIHRQQIGMTTTELSRLMCLQRVLDELVNGSRKATLNLGRLASRHGFCDQSHLIRTVRQLTGFAPGELIRTVWQEPGLWAYRALLGNPRRGADWSVGWSPTEWSDGPHAPLGPPPAVERKVGSPIFLENVAAIQSGRPSGML